MDDSIQHWYKVSLTKEQTATGPAHGVLWKAFSERQMRGQIPSKAALFSKTFGEQGGPELYFSPDSVAGMQDLLTKYGGVECEPPSYYEVGLLIGYDGVGKDLLLEPKEEGQG